MQFACIIQIAVVLSVVLRTTEGGTVLRTGRGLTPPTTPGATVPAPAPAPGHHTTAVDMADLPVAEDTGVLILVTRGPIPGLIHPTTAGGSTVARSRAARLLDRGAAGVTPGASLLGRGATPAATPLDPGAPRGAPRGASRLGDTGATLGRVTLTAVAA